MIWSQQGWLHQLLMINSASVNLIGVHQSHGALALDGCLAMTCVWSPSIEIQSFIALWLQLGFGDSIRVLIKWLTKCDWMAKSQLSQTHSLILNCLLRYSNFSLIQSIAWHWYCNHSFFIEYTERKPFLVLINTISWVFVDYSLMRLILCS